MSCSQSETGWDLDEVRRWHMAGMSRAIRTPGLTSARGKGGYMLQILQRQAIQGALQEVQEQIPVANATEGKITWRLISRLWAGEVRCSVE